VPGNFDGSLIDGWIQVSDKDAYSTARRLLREEGITCGLYMIISTKSMW